MLSPETVSKIAAGEVVERPASALKELIENSLDAGAGTIRVDIEHAGRALIRVSDDGCGISPDDLETAALRHSTSKISSFEDLDSLSTFGFRGEALYSIAAVSRLSVTSCEHGADSGLRLEIEGGKIVSKRQSPPVPGTTIEVRDLFFNVPARAKFLKSDATERAHLLKAAEECILANPDVAFHVRADGAAALDVAASPGGSARALLDRAAQVMGARVAKGMLYVEDAGIGLTAVISPPDNLAASRSLQYFFVNRRPVSGKAVSQALYRAYARYRGKNHPACAVFLELPPADFDVNIHPQKLDVRFKNESLIFRRVAAAAEAALSGAAKPAPVFRAPPPQAVQIEPPSAAGIVRIPEPVQITLEDLSDLMGAAAAPAGAVRETAEQRLSVEDLAEQAPAWWRPPYRYIGQLENSYLIFETGDGLAIVDQHAAQEKVIFEEYMRQLSSKMTAVQQFMMPVLVELPASAAQNILNWQDWLLSAGFEIEQAGPAALLVRSAPAALRFTDSDAANFVERLSGAVSDPDNCAEDVKRETVALLACKRAVKAGDSLSPQEAVRLLYDLKNCREGMTCPHGRPTMTAISSDELARRFKRSGAAGNIKEK